MENVITDIAKQLPAAALMAAILIFILKLFDRWLTNLLEQFTASESRRDQLMQEFWASQQVSNRDALERLASSIERMIDQLDAHDKKTDKAIATMEERTAPRPTQRPGRKPAP
jgi:hypothetical protein